MKKKLFLWLSLCLFYNASVFAQQSISISGPSTVEVGVPQNYTFTFNPVYPSNNGVQADMYIITQWIVTTDSNGGSNGTIPGYIGSTANQENYYSDPTYEGSNPKTVSIQWGNGSSSSSDNVTVKISGIYRKASTGENIGYFTFQPQAVKQVTVQRIENPVIQGPSAIASCSQTNQTYTIANGSNSDIRLWSVTGATIIGSATGNSVLVQPNLMGNFNISCTVKRSGANPNYSKSSTKTVTRLPFTSAATITGASTFCTSSSYTLNGLLPNQTVTWSLSGLNGVLSSTTGTSTTVTGVGNRNGDINLIATITNACGETFTIVKNLTIGVNGLFAVLTTPSGYPYSYPYTNAPEGCADAFYVFKTSSENTNLYNSTKKMQFTCNGITVTKLPVANYQFHLYASDFNIPQGNSFVVTAKVVNSCGVAVNQQTFTLYRPTLCQCGIGSGCLQLPRMANPGSDINVSIKNFKVYPIPSDSYLNIELVSDSISSNVELSIYNMIGQVVKKLKVTDKSTTIDVSNYDKGVYFIKINNNGVLESHQFIVK
ncbi:T9SS type A sorting domain-containing protein [Flavobacterium sp. Sd200]|uniref:T9SS type A sorting domain-containing protein n=1 Tax=Flavobacterium sp. Sd200 TaxID=2692211 RepID=UPI001367F555|nr:T9SS type A sorting domain-containing protein [Flavobacterium sp. Sd200]MXN92445.1 T9SS type A sorting domain-containing protein [Flavobacterium sp. Sd200]